MERRPWNRAYRESMFKFLLNFDIYNFILITLPRDHSISSGRDSQI